MRLLRAIPLYEGSGDGEASPGPDQAMANATAMTQAMPLAKCHHANTQR